MKRFKVCAGVFVMMLSPLLFAVEVVKEVEDTVGGKAVGGALGLLIGGAVSGGPVGALAGGLLGVWGGGFAQSEAGLSQRAYLVKADNGELETVRSPGQAFESGDPVKVVDGRLHKAE